MEDHLKSLLHPLLVAFFKILMVLPELIYRKTQECQSRDNGDTDEAVRKQKGLPSHR